MKKSELAALEKVFAAEIEAAIQDKPLLRLFQSKAKVFKELADAGYLNIETVVIGSGPFAARVTGYTLSIAGNMAYCASCDLVADEGM